MRVATRFIVGTEPPYSAGERGDRAATSASACAARRSSASRSRAAFSSASWLLRAIEGVPLARALLAQFRLRALDGVEVEQPLHLAAALGVAHLAEEGEFLLTREEGRRE